MTATPIILPPAHTVTATIISPTATETSTITTTPTATILTASPTPTTVQGFMMEILGCNTSLDVMHGMGEVTNAYVRITNNGGGDLTNLCTLLRAPDEDREHPDKQACLSALPAQSQVVLKLTVDSAYKNDTAIQVDLSSGEQLLLRIDRLSCTDISLFGGAPEDTGIIQPLTP